MTTNKPDRALTIRQPWIWSILYAGKRIENRSWQTHYRGLIYLHAAVKPARKTDITECARILEQFEMTLPDMQELPRGCLVATARIVDCLQITDMRGMGEQAFWAQKGAWHWMLDDLHPLAQPIPMHGRLNLWKVS